MVMAYTPRACISKGAADLNAISETGTMISSVILRISSLNNGSEVTERNVSVYIRIQLLSLIKTVER
jgi:hypothetical protein